ncbi:DUF6397 family protein [Streptomyces harbinensis]|uniref:DUF6397 family protein n=1 Tax=Streptomyces harbinensis TaxID=1176198 RepID=UPI0036B1C12A
MSPHTTQPHTEPSTPGERGGIAPPHHPAQPSSARPSPARPGIVTAAPPLLGGEDDVRPRPGDVPTGAWTRGTRTVARELGLRRHEFEAAIELGALPTLPCAGPPWRRRVPRAALDRLRGDRRTRAGLRDRVHLVNATDGAALLGISTARFTRLARGGCFSPVGFHLNRYQALVWRYSARELRDFAGYCPHLLRGRAPDGLRRALAAGTDWRPRKWRGRRTALLARQATGPWEKAAVPAALLEPPTLRELVPDPEERTRLRLLRPPLLPADPGGTRTDRIREILRATDPDEIRWYRSLLGRHLTEARAARPAPGEEPAPCTAR